ncbi:histidine kinase [Methylovorus sp. MM2]|uniref:sensor histidine kinase n=1 Tax=Methylovorus sp. MM2 TaxID=1848038 RepID=UPI0007E19326|nr:sensor histidine kinase [Methylovorus sp. MM2]OAM52067.1 histidine kinase [Methylovorus sp. MM2]
MIHVRKETLTTLGLASAVLILITISYITYQRTNQFIASSRWVDHTYSVLLQLNVALSELKDAETGQRGYLLTNNERFLEPYNKALHNLPKEIALLKQLTINNKPQYEAVLTFSDLVKSKLRYLELSITYQQKNGWKGNPDLEGMLVNGRMTMDEIRVHIANMSILEEQLLDQRSKIVEADGISTKQYIIMGNLSAIVLLLISFWLTSQEIKKRVIAQRNAEQTSAKLEMANKELESFSYSVSHDLRSPLRAIDGYSRIFEEDYAEQLDDEGKRLLTVVRSNSQKMGRLIDDLLDFARSGRKSIQAEEIDMAHLVDEVWKDIQLAHQTPLPPLNTNQLLPIWGDRALIKQVLMNLLSNAVKYSSKKNDPKIEITSAKKGSDVVYEIHDNGAGFDMRYYNKLFGVFQRLHSTDEFPGTGVGLAIVQRIVVRHGGHAWAESQLGEGSIFSFSLPLGARDE